MVLLKNNGLLPLKAPQHIAVIGRAAEKPHFQGGGSSHINATKSDVPFKELQNLAGNAELTYSAGYPDDVEIKQSLIDEAVTVAQAAEVAVLYIALPGFKESEGYDRSDMDLTPPQVALIKAVCAVQPRTVVVLSNGSAIGMTDWIDLPAAILEAWLGGQASGGTVADVLFGKVNPSGKLAETFPLKLTDTPAYIHYPGGNGEVRYGEGLFIGYRYYDARRLPVQFPFGYGLSYTTFQYSNPQVSAGSFKDTEGVTVSVDVTNTGQMAGKEIVQVYVHDRKSKLVRPPKELKGFAKVSLEPGETKTVTVQLDFRSFACYHPGYTQWITETGEFDILIGASAADIRFTETVTLQSTQVLPSLLNRESTVRDWMDDPHGQMIMVQTMQEMAERMGQAFGGGDSDSDGMSFLEFMMEMPLVSLLEFQERQLPAPATQIVDGLLAKLPKQ